jgi:hypothetical protein
MASCLLENIIAPKSPNSQPEMPQIKEYALVNSLHVTLSPFAKLLIGE